jgi:glucose/arabinose dehydrogenase
MWIALIGLVWLAISWTAAADSPALPPCDRRPHFIDPPWVSVAYYCAEEVVDDPDGGILAFSALAVGNDGTLYATRPLTGQLLALTDTNGDRLPDSPRVIASGLTLPNGLAYADGALYIVGGSNVDRLRDGQLERLVNDLPTGSGFWNGSIAFGPDARLYVSTGAACDHCLGSDPQRGAVLSFAADGSDRRLEAVGLRAPTDLLFRGDTLWLVDSARDHIDSPGSRYDELNRFVPGSRPLNFGWPFCLGAENLPDFPAGTSFDCELSVPPAYTFETHSRPLGIAAYTGEAFPHLTGSLLVVLGGSSNQAHLLGYTLTTVQFDPSGQPVGDHVILPEIPSDNPAWTGLDIQKIHYQASGFWPNRPLDVAVSPEGWIYVSLSAGRIWALRPR